MENELAEKDPSVIIRLAGWALEMNKTWTGTIALYGGAFVFAVVFGLAVNMVMISLFAYFMTKAGFYMWFTYSQTFWLANAAMMLRFMFTAGISTGSKT